VEEQVAVVENGHGQDVLLFVAPAFAAATLGIELMKRQFGSSLLQSLHLVLLNLHAHVPSHGHVHVRREIADLDHVLPEQLAVTAMAMQDHHCCPQQGTTSEVLEGQVDVPPEVAALTPLYPVFHLTHYSHHHQPIPHSSPNSRQAEQQIWLTGRQ